MPPYMFSCSCHKLVNVVHQLVEQPLSGATANAEGSHLAELFTPKLARNTASPRKSCQCLPEEDFSRCLCFPLHWCMCVHVGVWMLKHEWVKWVTAANGRPFSQSKGFPWAACRNESSVSALSFSCPHLARMLRLMKVRRRANQSEHAFSEYWWHKSRPVSLVDLSSLLGISFVFETRPKIVS